MIQGEEGGRREERKKEHEKSKLRIEEKKLKQVKQ